MDEPGALVKYYLNLGGGREHQGFILPRRSKASKPSTCTALPWPTNLKAMDLYVAFLGGQLEAGRVGEGHEVVLVVADSLKEAKTKAKAKWGGHGRGHIDAVQRIDQIDGFALTLTPGDEPGDKTELTDFN